MSAQVMAWFLDGEVEHGADERTLLLSEGLFFASLCRSRPAQTGAFFDSEDLEIAQVTVDQDRSQLATPLQVLGTRQQVTSKFGERPAARGELAQVVDGNRFGVIGHYVFLE